MKAQDDYNRESQQGENFHYLLKCSKQQNISENGLTMR